MGFEKIIIKLKDPKNVDHIDKVKDSISNQLTSAIFDSMSVKDTTGDRKT